MRVILTDPTETIRKIATLIYLSEPRSHLGDFLIGLGSLVVPVLMLLNLSEPVDQTTLYSFFILVFVQTFVGVQGVFVLYQYLFWRLPPAIKDVRQIDGNDEFLLKKIFGVNEGCVFHPMVEKYRYILWIITILLMFLNGWGLLATASLIIFISKMLTYVKLVDFYQEFLSDIDPEWKGCLRIKF